MVAACRCGAPRSPLDEREHGQHQRQERARAQLARRQHVDGRDDREGSECEQCREQRPRAPQPDAEETREQQERARLHEPPYLRPTPRVERQRVAQPSAHALGEIAARTCDPALAPDRVVAGRPLARREPDGHHGGDDRRDQRCAGARAGTRGDRDEGEQRVRHEVAGAEVRVLQPSDVPEQEGKQREGNDAAQEQRAVASRVRQGHARPPPPAGAR